MEEDPKQAKLYHPIDDYERTKALISGLLGEAYAGDGKTDGSMVAHNDRANHKLKSGLMRRLLDYMWFTWSGLKETQQDKTPQNGIIWSEVSRLERIAENIDAMYAGAMRNRELAMKNEVTGAPGIHERDNDIHLLMRRNKHPHMHFYVVMADINDFGNFNKKYGEDVGDKVLKATIEIINDCTREHDIVESCKAYHLHGDEIQLIMQMPNDAIAALVVNRLRDSLSRRSKKKTDGYHVTATFGFARWDIEHEELAVAQKRADFAMKEGKKIKKNKVYPDQALTLK